MKKLWLQEKIDNRNPEAKAKADALVAKHEAQRAAKAEQAGIKADAQAKAKAEQTKAKAEQTKAKAAQPQSIKDVTFTHAKYLGGLPGTKPATGNLTITASAIGMGTFKITKGVVNWEDAQSISFESGSAHKSRAGKALLVGVFALAAKNTQNSATITVTLKDGNAALYQIDGVNGAVVRGKIQAIFSKAGVICSDDAQPIQQASAVSVADEIGKLAALHESGAISDEEFSAHKAKLLS